MIDQLLFIADPAAFNFQKGFVKIEECTDIFHLYPPSSRVASNMAMQLSGSTPG